MFEYNNAVWLWENERKSNPEAVAIVADGHIGIDGRGWLARCKDNADAVDILTRAGWPADRIKAPAETGKE